MLTRLPYASETAEALNPAMLHGLARELLEVAATDERRFARWSMAFAATDAPQRELFRRWGTEPNFNLYTMTAPAPAPAPAALALLSALTSTT